MEVMNITKTEEFIVPEYLPFHPLANDDEASLERWKRIVSSLDFALQPIVNIYSGFVFGFEVLLREWQAAGFHSIQHVFDTAFSERKLYTLDMLLREKAIDKFVKLPFHQKCKLFYNLDNRVLLMPDYAPGNTGKLLTKNGLHPSMTVFEISERHEMEFIKATEAILNQYKQQAFKIAIDDFGSGFSGLQLLFRSEPELIKIDRFFIEGSDSIPKKRLLLSSIVNLAHMLGVLVIAEGVETEAEFMVCKMIGCDLVQGYLIQRPVQDLDLLKSRYESVMDLNKRNRRKPNSPDKDILREQMVWVEPIRESLLYDLSAGFNLALDFLQKDGDRTFFPVINDNDEPLGIIREKELKGFAYSRYGKDLLHNRSVGITMMDFIKRCPIMDIHTRIEHILEIVTKDLNIEGLILTENGHYAGFLNTLSILRVVNEKNLSMASDQNPLTHLPGNIMINDQLALVLEDVSSPYILGYFDIDHFKAFNDSYGFRLGDRAILMFADIIKDISLNRFFIGHIGGDDFFTIFKLEKHNDFEIMGWIEQIIHRFSEDASSLHNTQDRKQGYMLVENRQGKKEKFPLLSVSAAVLKLPIKRVVYSIEDIGKIAAVQKKKAKLSSNKIDCIEIPFIPIMNNAAQETAMARYPTSP